MAALPAPEVQEGDKEEGEDGQEGGLPQESCNGTEHCVNSLMVFHNTGKSREVAGISLSVPLAHNPQVDPVGSKDLQDDCQKDCVEKLGKNPVSEKMDDSNHN